MVIAFYYPNGTRSNVTLEDALVRTWSLAMDVKSEKDTRRELSQNLIPNALNRYRDSPSITKRTELAMLCDIEDAIQFDYMRKYG